MLFLLWLHLFILFGVISSLISISILGTYWPGEFIFQCPIFLPFHTVHGVLKARILKCFAIPFSSGPLFSELSTLTHVSWVALHGVAYSFIELEKAVVLVWLDWLIFCEYGFSVFVLWWPLATPTVLEAKFQLNPQFCLLLPLLFTASLWQRLSPWPNSLRIRGAFYSTWPHPGALSLACLVYLYQESC